jgi:hypothetical protein
LRTKRAALLSAIHKKQQKMKFKIFYEGEKALITKLNGRSKVIDGPKRVFVCLDKAEKLQQYAANLSQYLTIKYLDGNVVHRRGPTQEWFNRLVHEKITTCDLLQLNLSQVIVVYSRDDNSNTVQRRLVHGPCTFMPQANEWLQTFSWHSEDPKNAGRIIPSSAKFSLLTMQSDFFNYSVHEVRTLDDTLLTVNVMIVYELGDVCRMLDATQDPISDFINAICADVVSFVGKYAFSEFLSESHRLNNFESYANLTQRAERIGFAIKSIVYNGYQSSAILQDIQDEAIQRRTEIRLNAEINKEKERMIDMRVQKENERMSKQMQLSQMKNAFLYRLNDEKCRHQLQVEDLKYESEVEMNRIIQACNEKIEQLKNEVEQEYLDSLNEIGVDVNKYVTERAESQHKVDSKFLFI